MKGSDGRLTPWVGALVLVVGLVLTAGLTLAARAAHHDNEDRLLTQRTREAGAVLKAAVPSIEGPLITSAGLADVADEANPDMLEGTLGSQVGPKGRFVSASLWPIDALEPTAVVGDRPSLLKRPTDEIEAFFARTEKAKTMTVLSLMDGDEPRLGYAFSEPGGRARYLVYAEQALPARRTAVPRTDEAFSGLDYAIYLGRGETGDALLTASTGDLPIGGRRSTTEVAFGDTQIRLVMTPREDLGGSLLRFLPWMVLAVGLVTTLSAAALTDRLQRGRQVAQSLATENARLYDEQRADSLTLQQSLLPQVLPSVPGVEVAVRYQAGVAGTDVGGDWYDVVSLPDGLGVVVGDVSGRGLRAAGVMGSVRHTMRTLLSRGLEPGVLLAETTKVVGDGGPLAYFATAICGCIDLDRRTMSFASAGHPPPLLVSEDGARWIDVPVGAPVGVPSQRQYDEVSVAIPPGATLVLVTDGLYERRGESVDIGLERVRAVAESGGGTLDELLDRLLADLTGGAAHDDTAILGIRLET